MTLAAEQKKKRNYSGYQVHGSPERGSAVQRLTQPTVEP
jgi:hypothetical protein